MKTPEEIKKGLECCITRISEGKRTTCNAGCKYLIEGIFCRNVLHGDTLAYIQHLESRLAQVERERDAAIGKLKAYEWYEGERAFPKGMTQAEYFGIAKEDAK